MYMRDLIRRVLREESFIDDEGNLTGFEEPTEDEIFSFLTDHKITYEKFMQMSSPFVLHMLLNSHGLDINIMESEYLSEQLEEVYEEGRINTMGEFSDVLNDLIKSLKN